MQLTRKDLTDLVAITPLVVLGADVLVRILGALLQRRHVVPVVPVLVPEPVGVGTRQGEGGDDAASILLALVRTNASRLQLPILRDRPSARNSLNSRVGNVQDGDLLPELCQTSAIISNASN